MKTQKQRQRHQQQQQGEASAGENDDDDGEDGIPGQMQQQQQLREEGAPEAETASNAAAAGTANDEDDDNAESSSSTGSNSEEKGGGGSGGGYSADYSGDFSSDQSSDDTTSGREGSKKKKEPLRLSVDRLNLKDATRRGGDDHDDDDDETEMEEDGGDSSRMAPPKRRQTKKAKAFRDAQNALTLLSTQRKRERGGTSGDSVALPNGDDGQLDLGGEFKVSATEKPQPPPQWGGIRITHPMDPRIDLSTVKFHHTGTWATGDVAGVPTTTVASLTPSTTATTTVAAASQAHHQQYQQQDDWLTPTIESYLQLLDVVRPFFQTSGVPFDPRAVVNNSNDTTAKRPEMEEKTGDGEDQQRASGSEGFTSFFSTTHSSSGANNNENSGTPTSSSPDQDKKPKAEASKSTHNDDVDDTDNCSMVVLARVKSKYRRSDEENSDSSCERRVRILEEKLRKSAQRDDDDEPMPDAAADSGNDQGNVKSEGERSLPESSMSSDSSRPRLGDVVAAVAEEAEGGSARRLGLPPRIVTDVSSSARTDSNSSSNQNSGSGSGSGSAGNTGTGSGSNQGSSGSGNDGSGNDGKGSSEEATKEDKSCEGTNEGSDGASSSCQKLGIGLAVPVVHRHEPVTVEASKTGIAPNLDDVEMQEPDEAVRERKIQDKKRKRIEMRREYEALQESESSENGNNDTLFRPGRPVTLDQALQFSKIPR